MIFKGLCCAIKTLLAIIVQSYSFVLKYMTLDKNREFGKYVFVLIL